MKARNGTRFNMPLSKLQFTPGINKEMTDLMDKGGWADGNLVRFGKNQTTALT